MLPKQDIIRKAEHTSLPKLQEKNEQDGKKTTHSKQKRINGQEIQ